VTGDPVESTAAPAAAKPAKAATAKKPTAAHSARRRSREFALQGLYQWLVAGGDAASGEAHIMELDDFRKCDRAHFDALYRGAIEQATALDAVLKRHIDRRPEHLSPVEHAVLMLGTYELMHCVDIPYRVAINEAVELAKSFGGTDGHKYVNGVLDKAAAELRPLEARGARPRPATRPVLPPTPQPD
jgi:transcription antitermination protein NusB